MELATAATPPADADADGGGGPTQTTTRVRVDHRERALLAHLSEVEVCALPLGDVEIRGGDGRTILIERKTLADLAASVRDGRWVEQRARASLAADAAPMLLVLETEGAWAWDERLRSPSGILPASLQGAVLAAAVLSSGGPVVFTRDPPDTAALVRRLARLAGRPVSDRQTSLRGYEAAACQAACAGPPKRGALLTPRLCLRQQLCMVPGVSARLAGALVDAFLPPNDADADAGTGLLAWARAVEAASDGDAARALRRVPGVGAKTADNLLTFVWGKPRTPGRGPRAPPTTTTTRSRTEPATATEPPAPPPP